MFNSRQFVFILARTCIFLQKFAVFVIIFTIFVAELWAYAYMRPQKIIIEQNQFTL